MKNARIKPSKVARLPPHRPATNQRKRGHADRFQQAKRAGGKLQFLQIVAKPDRKSKEPKLTRVAFSVSRLMEFCTKRELQNQTGHSVFDWPLVALKELIDNALDACEEAEIAPVISISVTSESMVIKDNGLGIETDTIESILNYGIRVSSREAYVSPTRGQQGNALKTILAMGYVLDREREDEDTINNEAVGVTFIETRGVKHRIEFRADHVTNQPKITHTTTTSPLGVGTRITIKWPELDEWVDEDQFKQLADSYVWFNPHLSLRGTWHGKPFINVAATNPTWGKWGPRNPTSAFWYDRARLQRYLGAHVARDRDLRRHRTVREFISEFRGFAGTAIQRKVLEEVGCSHMSLACFFGVDRVNRRGIAKLLASMQRHSKPVAPKHLGVIGAEHFKQRFLAAGGQGETFNYQLRKGTTPENIPYVIEVVFGLHRSALKDGDNDAPRKLITGANWSVGINNPFRAFGSTGEGLEATLSKVRADSRSTICAVHLASAYIQYADRGKSSIILDDDASQPDE
jgi:hypothetical protein